MELRKDKIEIALSSGNFGERDYAVFCADTEKQAGARTEKGMTYFGGDKAILNDYFTEKNDAVKTEIPSWKYTCKIAVEKKMLACHVWNPMGFVRRISGKIF